MALRAELIGPYRLILVTSSVCADWNLVGSQDFDIGSERRECLCQDWLRLPSSGWWQHCSLGSRVIGQQLTAESELARTPGIRLSN